MKPSVATGSPFGPTYLHTRYRAVVIGGSAGSFQLVGKLLAALPTDFPLPIILCLHRLKHVRHGFVEALSIKSNLPIREPEDKEHLKRGTAYLAPANYHLLLDLGPSFALSTDEMVNNSRPAIDLTLDSASYVFRDKLIGILLSGANRDGAFGMKRIAERGGHTIVQDPAESMIDTMPAAALRLTPIDQVLPIAEIIGFLTDLHKKYAFS